MNTTEPRSSTGPSSDLACDPPLGAWGHLLDLLFWRAMGMAMLTHEYALTPAAEWPLVVGGFCAFFMPDWLRGTNSLPIQLARAIAQRVAGTEEGA
jgi:hypothetical protein